MNFNLSSTTIKQRMLLRLAVFIFLLIAVGGTGLYGMRQVRGAAERFVDEYLAEVTELAQIAANMNLIGVDLRRAAQSESADVVAETVPRVRALIEDVSAGIENLQALVVHPDVRVELDEFVAKRVDLKSAYEEMIDTLQERDYERALAIESMKVLPALDPSQRALTSLVTATTKVADRDVKQGRALTRILLFAVVILIVLSVVLSLLFDLLFIRGLNRRLQIALEVANRIAHGELGAGIEAEERSQNEIDRLLVALREMDGKLSQIVEEVKQGAQSVSSASREIAAGNDDLSARTQQQASFLEETAANMEEMTATVRQNAENASQANQLARGAREQAESGGEVVARAVAAMAAINESSRRIADIIGVIDEIAFQTNLLALNAAVEAARAGEQGRGFAVVASEVRNLAQRSAGAAKEIKGLINDSVDKVGVGTSLVDESGKTLARIVESVKKVTDIVGEIAAASHEQTAGIDQVNRAVMAMDEMTQQNAALVEEAAAASRAMQDQAESLNRNIAFFRTSAMLSAAPTKHAGTGAAATKAAGVAAAATSPKPVERVGARPVVKKGAGVTGSQAVDKVPLTGTPAKASSAQKDSDDDGWAEF